MRPGAEASISSCEVAALEPVGRHAVAIYTQSSGSIDPCMHAFSSQQFCIKAQLLGCQCPADALLACAAECQAAQSVLSGISFAHARLLSSPSSSPFCGKLRQDRPMPFQLAHRHLCRLSVNGLDAEQATSA